MNQRWSKWLDDHPGVVILLWVAFGAWLFFWVLFLVFFFVVVIPY